APAVAKDGTNYFVIWQDTRWEGSGVYGSRVTPSAAVLDPNGSLVGANGTNPAVTFNGSEYLVVWDGIYGRRFGLSGGPIDAAPFKVANGDRPSLAFDGLNFVTVFDSGSDRISGARVASAGNVLDPNGLLI